MLAATDQLSALSQSLAELVETASQCVVAVNGNQRIASSGIVLRSGVIATSDHVLRRDDEITIVLPGNKTVPAKLAGRDPGTDLAVLTAETGGVKAAAFAPADSLRAGNMVLAVGRRGENGPTASLGVISALGGPWRTWRNGQIDRFVRADVSLYPGSSGSALVDMDGRVIGLNTAGLTRNWSVTVPHETLLSVTTALIEHGEVSRGFLGVGLHPVRLPDGKSGLIVVSLEAGGPAEKAGILIGDVLLELGGKSVEDTDDVQRNLGPDRVGKPVEATINRGGNTLRVAITPAARPKGSR